MLRALCAADPATCAAAMAAGDPLDAILPLLEAGDLDLRLERAAAEALGTLLAASARLRADAKAAGAGPLLVGSATAVETVLMRSAMLVGAAATRVRIGGRKACHCLLSASQPGACRCFPVAILQAVAEQDVVKSGCTGASAVGGGC